jgi:hypothetical protein
MQRLDRKIYVIFVKSYKEILVYYAKHWNGGLFCCAQCLWNQSPVHKILKKNYLFSTRHGFE